MQTNTASDYVVRAFPRSAYASVDLTTLDTEPGRSKATGRVTPSIAVLCAALLAAPITAATAEVAVSRSFEPVIRSAPHSENPLSDDRAALARQRFAQLCRLVSDEPVESGMSHQGETALADFLVEFGPVALRGILFSGPSLKRSQVASLLILLARIEPSRIGAADRITLLSTALQSSDVEVRDAAIQVGELWGDPVSMRVLAAHRDVTPWLESYRRRVVEQGVNGATA